MKKSSFYLLCAALSASAVADSGYVTTARVVDSAPIIETVYEPVETCRYETRRERPSKKHGFENSGDKLLGGLIGGGVGSAFGKGKGRDAAAAIGAILGGEIAAGDGELSGGELIGGVAGGVIGNQVGGGRGKTAATAAGALIGSIVGDNIQKGTYSETATASEGKKVRVCDVEDRAKKVITGYEVTVEHDGFHFTDVVSRKPGDYLNINVNVEFVEDLTVQSR